MPKYRVRVIETTRWEVEVEAESEGAALKMVERGDFRQDDRECDYCLERVVDYAEELETDRVKIKQQVAARYQQMGLPIEPDDVFVFGDGEEDAE